jgi:DNA-binding GntR family transcriptional regulator
VRPGLELTRVTYQFRSIIERAAVRVFAEQADEQLLADLTARHQALIQRIEAQGLMPGDLPEVDALEQLIHSNVVGIMQNPLIDISYRRMMNYLRLLRLDRKFTSPIILRTLREHLDILTALQAHLHAAIQRNIGFM